MAVPAYTKDLVDIDLAEAGSTGLAINFSGGGGGAPAAGIDLAMQGTNAWDRPVSNAERGILFNNTGLGTAHVATGVHIFQWLFCGTPGLTDVIANRGAYLIAGTAATTDLVQFHVEGNLTYGAAGRVGKCYPYRYINTASGVSPYRTLTGTPGATPTYFGAGLKTLNSAKGSNLGVDAVRYGTGAYLTAGELLSAGDGSDNPCTFIGFQAQNDAIANRWGILTGVGGGFELQGTFAIGQNSSKTATLCRFRASDRSIVIVNTIHSETTFSKFIIDHASTRCEWNNINILALGTNNRGSILVNNAATTFLATGGVWEGLSTIGLKAASVCTGVTMRLTDLITLGGGTLTSCSIDRNRNATSVLAATLTNITKCNFISDGSNHAVQLSSIGGGSMTWNNTLSGYVAGVSASPVTPTSTGNEAIYVNVVSGTLTINVAAGATVPSIRSAGATVNVIAGAVTYTITVQNTSGTKIQNARVYMPVAAGGSLPYQASVTITRSGSTATVTHTAHGLSTGNKVVIKGAVQREYWGIFTITVTGTNTYTFTVTGTPTTPATGTITSTFVLISALTDVLGVASGSRTFVTNQPISGNVRKSSASPYYKTGALVGTINKDSGLDLTITLLSDE
jgi:uncharacterized repeat protein (TIGR01451 family)